MILPTSLLENSRHGVTLVVVHQIVVQYRCLDGVVSRQLDEAIPQYTRCVRFVLERNIHATRSTKTLRESPRCDGVRS